MEIRPMFRGLYGLGCLLAALATPPAGAAPLFRPCEEVASRSKSEPLRQALWQGEGCVGDECRDYYRVGVCLPLGREALIYEDQETGTSFQGLYYLRLDQPDMEPERLTTSVRKITELRTANGRRFALIEDGWALHGRFSRSIHLLERTPGWGRGFRLTTLVSRYDNEGCAGFEPPGGCGPAYYELVLDDGLRELAPIATSAPLPDFQGLRLLPDPGRVSMIELDLGVGESDERLVLRYRWSGQSRRFLGSDMEAVWQRLAGRAPSPRPAPRPQVAGAVKPGGRPRRRSSRTPPISPPSPSPGLRSR